MVALSKGRIEAHEKLVDQRRIFRHIFVDEKRTKTRDEMGSSVDTGRASVRTFDCLVTKVPIYFDGLGFGDPGPLAFQITDTAFSFSISPADSAFENRHYFNLP